MEWLKRYFELDAHRTTVTTEIRAGTSTFLTMPTSVFAKLPFALAPGTGRWRQIPLALGVVAAMLVGWYSVGH